MPDPVGSLDLGGVSSQRCQSKVASVLYFPELQRCFSRVKTVQRMAVAAEVAGLLLLAGLAVVAPPWDVLYMLAPFGPVEA